jgi:glycosyltransferase involved in cell wall biosynthesis
VSRLLHVTFVVTRADDIGGAQVHVRDLALALQQRGHRISVISGRPGPLSSELAQQGVEFRSAPHLGRAIRPVSDVRAFVELRRTLRELQPDLVSTHSSKAGVLGRLAARSLGLPALFTAHGWSFGKGRPWPQRWLYQLVEKAVAPLGGGVVTVSHADLDLALRAGVARPDRLITVHNAMPPIGTDLFAHPGNTPPALVMVARFAPPKDQTFVLEALSLLTDRAWSLSFVGEGPGEQAARRLSMTLGLDERVSFLGYRPNVAELLSGHQIFTLASNFEGLPRSVLEAMRAGLPVVSTDVGGVREAVEHGESGFIVPVGDRRAFADCLARLLDLPELRVRMGARARSRFEDRFSFEKLVDSTLAVYGNIIAGEPLGSTPTSGFRAPSSTGPEDAS